MFNLFETQEIIETSIWFSPPTGFSLVRISRGCCAAAVRNKACACQTGREEAWQEIKKRHKFVFTEVFQRLGKIGNTFCCQSLTDGSFFFSFWGWNSQMCLYVCVYIMTYLYYQVFINSVNVRFRFLLVYIKGGGKKSIHSNIAIFNTVIWYIKYRFFTIFWGE